MDITFARPDYVEIDITLVVQNDGSLPDDADDLIKEAIISYTAGDLIPPSSGFNATGYGIAQSVPISSLLTPINQVIGQYGRSTITSLTVNTITDPLAVIAISIIQQALFTIDDISVTVNA